MMHCPNQMKQYDKLVLCLTTVDVAKDLCQDAAIHIINCHAILTNHARVYRLRRFSRAVMAVMQSINTGHTACTPKTLEIGRTHQHKAEAELREINSRIMFRMGVQENFVLRPPPDAKLLQSLPQPHTHHPASSLHIKYMSH